MLAARSVSCARPTLPARSSRGAVIVRASKVEDAPKMGSVAMAGMVAAALLGSSIVPEEAMAARSGGRAGGGGSGFSSRRAAAPAKQSTTVVNNTTVVAAPPVFSPFGFGFSPFGFGMGMGFGMPMFGGLLQFFFLTMIVSVVFNVIKSISDNNAQAEKKKDDDWGNL